MIGNLSSSPGVVALAILCLTALVGGLMFAQVISCAPAWEAWLADPEGGAYVDALKRLPVWLILAIIAMASPIALRLRR